MKSYDLRREVVVAKFQVLIDAINDLDGNTDEIEAKLDSIITLLTSLDGKDFATETTLTALEATANALETLLISIDGKVATEVTLAGIKAQTDLLTFTGGNLNVNATVTLPAGVSTEAKQDDQIDVLNDILGALGGSVNGEETEKDLISKLVVIMKFQVEEQRKTNNLLKLILS